MKDPLTKKELREFERLLIAEFRKEYDKVLSCGAFDEEEFGDKSDHRIAKIAAVCVGDRFYPHQDVARKALANYRHF